MDNKKVVEFNKTKKEKKQSDISFDKKLQTNPILRRMFSVNESSKKMKFKIKDLFR